MLGGDVAAGAADDAGDFQLEIEVLRGAGRGHGRVGAVDRVGVGEVEDRDVIPLRDHVEAAQGARRLDVLLEGVEVAQVVGPRHGGQQPRRGGQGQPI